MPENIKCDARYVQRILNRETLGLSSLPQVEQSMNQNSRQESVIPFSIIIAFVFVYGLVSAIGVTSDVGQGSKVFSHHAMFLLEKQSLHLK